MGGLEIVLLLIGVACIAGSFIFFNKLDPVSHQDFSINTELSEKQKEDIRSQIIKIYNDQSDELSEKTEIALEKLSNQKIKELSEYSETVLSEINKTHDKVMFLYDMLSEKNKEVNSTVRDLSVAKNQLDKAISEQAAAKAAETVEQPVAKPKTTRTRKKTQASAADTAESSQAEEVSEEAVKPAKKKSSANNRNKEILELHNAGMDNLEIAKELNIGTGEVKLVLDLFKDK